MSWQTPARRRILRLAALTGISVTGLVYATVLAPHVHLTGWASVYNHVFHYVVPIVSVLGFALIGPRPRFRTSDLTFMAWPVLWLVYTMLRGAFGHADFTGFGEAPSRYPYEFLDVDRVPLVEVIGAIAVVTALLVGIAIGSIHLARRLAPADVSPR